MFAGYILESTVEVRALSAGVVSTLLVVGMFVFLVSAREAILG